MFIKRSIIAAILFTAVTSMFSQEPVFRLRDLDQKWMEYSDLSGDNLTVIDFWATWCTPCVKSIPLLNEIFEEYTGKGVRFIGISIDGPRNQSKIKPFIHSLGITYPILRDVNSELMSDLNVTAVPTLLVFDADGEQLFFHEGLRPVDEKLIRNQLDEMLLQ